MTRITDIQAESSGWLFKSPLGGGGGTLWRLVRAAQLVQTGKTFGEVIGDSKTSCSYGPQCRGT